MTRKAAIQMKDRIFNGKDSLSLIVFLQDSKAARDTCNIYERAAMWVCKHYIGDPIGSIISTRVKLSAEISGTQDGCLMFSSAICSYVSKLYATEENIVMVYVDICTFKQQDITETYYIQNIWIKTIRWRSIYTDKVLNGLFIKVVNQSIRRALSRW